MGDMYNRLGKIATIAGAVGTRAFEYDDDYLYLKTESINGSGGGIFTKVITRKYDTTTAGARSRSTGFQVGVSGTPAADYEVTYAYDASSRLNRVIGPGLDTTYGATYSRLANSDAVEYTRFKNASDADVATAQRAYVGNRDLLDYVENVMNSSPTPTTLSKYDYTLDTLGRRTAVAVTGDMPASGDHHWDFGYNTRNEVTTADRREGTTEQQGDFLTPGDFDYTYDPIGNRHSTEVDSTTRYYCVDDVNGKSVNKYFTIDDESGCPKEPAEESFSYDTDGNLTADGTYTYVWDCENRLIEVYPTSPAAGSKKLVFDYDYMSRTHGRLIAAAPSTSRPGRGLSKTTARMLSSPSKPFSAVGN